MLVPAMLALFLGAVYVLVPYACEPRLKGRARSLALPSIPFAGWLAYLTVQGVWTGSSWMTFLPPVFVLLLCLHTLWMFRIPWMAKLRRADTSETATKIVLSDIDQPGDSRSS